MQICLIILCNDFTLPNKSMASGGKSSMGRRDCSGLKEIKETPNTMHDSWVDSGLNLFFFFKPLKTFQNNQGNQKISWYQRITTNFLRCNNCVVVIYMHIHILGHVLWANSWCSESYFQIIQQKYTHNKAYMENVNC